MEKKKFNEEWHKKNKIPENADFEEKIRWHIEHLKNCRCHGFPKKLRRLQINKIPLNL